MDMRGWPDHHAPGSAGEYRPRADIRVRSAQTGASERRGPGGIPYSGDLAV